MGLCCIKNELSHVRTPQITRRLKRFKLLNNAIESALYTLGIFYTDREGVVTCKVIALENLWS